jgi:hypothetical protein
MEIRAYVGHDYVLQRSSSVGPSAAWQDVGNPISGNGGMVSFSDVMIGGTFYRVRVIQ